MDHPGPGILGPVIWVGSHRHRPVAEPVFLQASHRARTGLLRENVHSG